MTHRWLPLLFLVPGLVASFGQEALLSNILGTVADPNRAVVVGAAVTLRNQGTGFLRTVQSDTLGNYLFNNIVPGTYTVSVELAGFKKYQQTGIDLTASRSLRVDVVLEVGDVTTTISVSSEAAVIETEAPIVSFSARNEIMNRVPTAASVQGGRIAHSYLYMIPGNVMSVEAASFNGLPAASGASRITLDGIRITDGGAAQTLPSLESLDEMKVVTHNASAEYATPSTVQLTTRQGGNVFHGDAWDLYGDKSMHARDPFLPSKSIFHGHTFGGSIGGPIKKNKLFFYQSFEGFRFNNVSVTVSAVTTNNVPTTLMQKGDFSELVDPAFAGLFNRGQSVPVKDPLNGQPFAGNIVPANRISAVSTNLVNTFWTAPTAPGLVSNQFTNALRPTRRDRPDLRMDYIFSPRHTFFARFGYTYIENAQPTVPFKLEHSNNLTQVWSNARASVSDTFIFSPRVTNEFRYGLTRFRLTFTSEFEREDVMAAAGLQGTGGITGLPGLTFTGTGSFSGIGARSFQNSTGLVGGVTDNVSFFTGKHSVKAGIQFNRSQSFASNLIGPPSFTFDGRLSGWSWADFMLGTPSSLTRQLAPTNHYLFQNEWGFFVQDEFRAKPNLTIQIGLRYQIWPYVHEKYNKLALFDLNRAALIIPSEETRRFIVPNFPQAQIPVLTAGQANYAAANRELISTDFNNWAPRIGFAWRVPGKSNFVVRGGYGIYYYNTTGATGATPTGALFLGSQTLTQQLGSNGTLTPTISFPNPFAGFQGPVGTLAPDSLSFTSAVANLKNPYVQEYSLTLEKEWKGWGARASYLGSMQTSIPHVVNYNEAAPSRLAFVQSRRPVPQVRDINLTENGGYTRNNAFQFEIKRPVSHGFFLSGGYTYMKNITDINNDFGGNTPSVPIAGTGGNFNRTERFKSNTNFTPRQQLILTYSYELPFGTGRRFLSHVHPIVNGVAGGWRIVGVTQLQAGRYLTPTYTGVDPVGGTPGTGPQIPDRIADGNLPRGQRNAFTGQPFFDVGAFVCPGGASINGQANLLTAGCPLSTPQNVGRFGNSSPTIVQGPGINTTNISLIKIFKLPREGSSIEFSAQFANPWNHPSWEASPNVNLSSPASVGRYSATRNDFLQPFAYGSRKIYLQLRINF